MRYKFKDVLSAPPPATARSCQPPARMRCPPPPLLLCHPPPNCPALCPPSHSSCCVVRRPIALPLSAPSTLASCVHPPPSHCVVCLPSAFLFDCCVLDWRRRDMVADPMSCIVRPFPLIVSPLHPCLTRPPPPLIVLSAAHPLFYLIVVCWIGRDRTWLPIQYLALSAPSLLSCYPPPACFAPCSPATCLPYLLIIMYWLMSLPYRDRDRHYL